VLVIIDFFGFSANITRNSVMNNWRLFTRYIDFSRSIGLLKQRINKLGENGYTEDAINPILN